MSNNAVPGSKSLANKIKQRRTELGLTIEEAASRAGVGTKTWCRYEAGESIRQDKVKGICKVLNWPNLIASENDVDAIKAAADSEEAEVNAVDISFTKDGEKVVPEKKKESNEVKNKQKINNFFLRYKEKIETDKNKKSGI